MNFGGEGVPGYLWSGMAGPDGDVLEYGAMRLHSGEGNFSLDNARVALIADRIAGMLLNCRLPDHYEIGPLDEYPQVVRPLAGLEGLALGSSYINAVATFPAYRARGVGARLMRLV